MASEIPKSDNHSEDFSSLFRRATDVATSEAELDDLYKTWAPTYDQHMSQTVINNGPALVAEAVAGLYKDKSRIRLLDLGCGTGKVGQEMYNRGFRLIDGIDTNCSMLVMAQEKNIYKDFYCMKLGKHKLGIPDDWYDALVASGTFVVNHANDSCFEELIRITKPGGHIAIIINVEFLLVGEMVRFEPRIKELEAKGMWKMVLYKDGIEYVHLLNKTNPEHAKLFVLKVL